MAVHEMKKRRPWRSILFSAIRVDKFCSVLEQVRSGRLRPKTIRSIEVKTEHLIQGLSVSHIRLETLQHVRVFDTAVLSLQRNIPGFAQSVPAILNALKIHPQARVEVVRDDGE